MAMMLTGLLFAGLGLCLTALGAMLLGGEVPEPVAVLLRSDGTRQSLELHRRSPAVLMTTGMVVQVLGAALATAVWTTIGATVAVALAWGCVGSAIVYLRHS